MVFPGFGFAPNATGLDARFNTFGINDRRLALANFMASGILELRDKLGPILRH